MGLLKATIKGPLLVRNFRMVYGTAAREPVSGYAPLQLEGIAVEHPVSSSAPIIALLLTLNPRPRDQAVFPIWHYPVPLSCANQFGMGK